MKEFQEIVSTLYLPDLVASLLVAGGIGVTAAATASVRYKSGNVCRNSRGPISAEDFQVHCKSL